MLSLLLVAAALAQGPDFSWSGALGDGKRLTVKNVIGDVRIEPATGGTATVTASKRAGREGDPKEVLIRQVQTGEGVTICVLYPGNRTNEQTCDQDGGEHRGNHDRNDTRVDFVVRLPAGASLSALTVAGDVLGHGIRGEVEARSVSGDVRLSDVTARSVEAQTVSGDVELLDVMADEVAAETVSGDVGFSGAIRPRGDYGLKTLSGDVVMRIPKGAGAEVTGATFSGDVTSAFALTTRSTGKYTSRKRVSGTIGDGSAQIHLESFSGNVTLREAGK
jgi:hypothetical protein